MTVVFAKRTLFIVLVVGALAAWLAGASTSGVRPPRPVLPPRPVDLRGAALAAEIERLHDRLRPTATPEHNRNLFQFAAPRVPVARPVPPAALVPAPIVAPVEPPFKLIGIADDAGTRTAILSSAAQLIMVKEGEVVASKYRVDRISPDAIELTDAADGSVSRLALK